MADPLGLPIGEAEIRRRFNQDIKPHIDSGVYTRRKASTWPSPKIAPGATTVIYEFVASDGKVMARCHCYEDKDGNLLASGKWDPKFIVHEGKAYRLRL